jgi:TrbB protein
MQAITLPFQVTIADDLMTIRYFRDGHPQMLGLIDLNQICHFALDGQNVIYMGELGQLVIQAPDHTNAAALLDCIESAVIRHKSGVRRRAVKEARRKVRRASIAAAALTVTAVALAFSAWSINNIMGFTAHQASASMAASYVAQVVPKNLKTTPPAATLPGAPPVVPGITTEPAEIADVAQDGWTLPESMRAALPVNLQMAAERKLFTVEYSSGHARTLYVFADPECPNCHRLEPALEAAAKDFNVVVFPVAVVGREKSIASITPVLCLPPEQRKAAWSDLFDVGHGVMELGKAQESAAVEPGHCDIAGKALGVNEVAYQTYRIPGTPWAISDDGRHVSQEVLQNPLKLQAFMGAVEVSHAAQ